MYDHPDLVITTHARRRWIERVDRTATIAEADEAICAMIAEGSRSKRPRRWLMQGRGRHRRAEGIGRQGAEAGETFIYSMAWPGVALLVIRGAVVTVLTREFTRKRRELLRANNYAEAA